MRRAELHPSRIFVYCHDTFGLGNARRMMAISTHLAEVFPRSNLLLASGSPVIHGFRMPDRLDYIKLPSVTRTDRECYAARSLTTTLADTIRLRSSLLKTAVADFEPDLVLVDKKPLGLLDELADALQFTHHALPRTKHVLVLRDILDAPQSTIPYLEASGFQAAVARYYDRVAVLGRSDIFDLPTEYRFRPETAERVAFCGYLRTRPGSRSPAEVRAELGVDPSTPLLVVTAGGGEDSGPVLDSALEAFERLGARATRPMHALIVVGPQTARDRLARIQATAGSRAGLHVLEFTDDMASYIAAADLVVSMGGYNAVCEALSLAQRAVIVPRCRPVQEQSLRAERMSRVGLLRAVDPERLSGALLEDAIETELRRAPVQRRQWRWSGLDGLSNLTALIKDVVGGSQPTTSPARTAPHSARPFHPILLRGQA